MSETKLTLVQKLLEIQKEMGIIQKNGHNDFQNYDFAREVDFVLAVRPLLNKYGVIIIPEGAVSNLSPVGKDNKSTLTTIIMKYKMINSDDVNDYIVATVPGQGTDNGDKGVYKAITGAKKYFIANTFMVPTGDDPENDVKVSSKTTTLKKVSNYNTVDEDF